MPEHRPDTPSRYRLLESFLWHDFAAGRQDWQTWLRRKMPKAVSADAAYPRAKRLHGALRALQAANSRLRLDPAAKTGAEVLNRLIAQSCIQPRLGNDGQLALVSKVENDPVAALILILLEALQQGHWCRFKLCHDASCGASFYDASKASAKTWCSMETR